MLGGQASQPMTNVRNLKLPQWRALSADPARRCLVPLTELCDWTPDKHEVGDGSAVRGELGSTSPTSRCSQLPALASHCQGPRLRNGDMRLERVVAPIHPETMITIFAQRSQALAPRQLRGGDRVQQPYPAEWMKVRGPVFPTRKARA